MSFDNKHYYAITGWYITLELNSFNKHSLFDKLKFFLNCSALLHALTLSEYMGFFIHKNAHQPINVLAFASVCMLVMLAFVCEVPKICERGCRTYVFNLLCLKIVSLG